MPRGKSTLTAAEKAANKKKREADKAAIKKARIAAGLPEEETKEEKLIRLSNKRVEKACKAISVLGNLATYKPTDADADAIMEALGGACAYVDSRLRNVKRAKYTFNLRTVPPSK